MFYTKFESNKMKFWKFIYLPIYATHWQKRVLSFRTEIICEITILVRSRYNMEYIGHNDIMLDEEKEKTSKYNYWVYFFRQLFTCGAVTLNFFLYGLYMGAPTVIIPQLRREANSTDVVTPEMASWLSSISAYSGLPWTIILPLLAHRFGRKYIVVLVTFISLIGNILFYCSASFMELAISLAIQGILAAFLTTLTMMVMSEYPSPKYRGVLLSMKSATFYWGVWVSNVIGTFYHWKNIGILALVCTIYNLSSVFYRESPYWLASNGRFDECAKAHRWLKGTDENAEEELRKLILSQQEHISNKSKHKENTKIRIHKKIMNILRYEGFYKPFAYAILPLCLYHFSGKMAYTVYAIDIIKKITSNEETAYGGMLILDAVTVLGMYVGSGLAKIVKRRTQLLFFSCIGVGFLFVLSLYLYMVKLAIISENKYFSIFLLIGFSISTSCGPIILSSSCAAELCPLRYRSYFLCYLSFTNTLLLASVVKFAPFIFKHFNEHGAFLFYAIASSFFVLLIYKYMPETKDLTIQEIQERITRRDCPNSVVGTETVALKGDCE